MALVVVALGLVVVTTSPAAADIAAISPARAEVNPGGSASATVTVRASALTCVNARPSDDRLQPSFSTTCNDDTPEWRTTLSVQAPDDPGTYSVRVTDNQSGEAGGRTFTLVVRAPPPPPPPPTEPTTTVSPTTTASPTTTTGPVSTTTSTTSTTTTAPSTTTTSTSTTTTTAPLADSPFTPLAELVKAPIPVAGVFFPLLGEGFRDCLPLTKACGSAGSGLALLPAAATEITWQPLAEGARAAPRIDLRGTATLAPIGVAPPEPRAQSFALAVLDLSAAGGQLRTLLRGIDERGRLGTVAADRPVLRATVGDGGPLVGVAPALSAMPFGRPTVRKASSFTESAPALPMFAAVEPQLIYALRPADAWSLNFDVIPLFAESVPFLVRSAAGPPGLFIARPPDLQVPEAAAQEAAPKDEANDGDGTSPLVLLGGAVVLGALATAATAIVRRRRAGDAPA